MSLSSEEVHVWRVSLDLSGAALDLLGATLAPEEIQRAERCLWEAPRRRFIASRGILRLLLGRYTGCSPALLSLRATDRGKPFLEQGSSSRPPSFNLSHSRDLALYAFTLAGEVGVDLESLDRPRLDPDAVAKRFFSPGEYRYLLEAPPERKHEIFFRLWTLKEACLKATGRGLPGLSSVEVRLEGEGEPPLPIELGDGPLGEWSLHRLHPAPGYTGALCTRGRPGVILWGVNAEKLILSAT